MSGSDHIAFEWIGGCRLLLWETRDIVLLPVSAYADRVHDLGDPGCLEGDRFRHLSLEVRIDQAGQIHYAIQGLHVEQIRRLQRRMLVE